MTKTLSLRRGDTSKFDVTVLDSTGAAMSVEGGKLFFTVKTKASDADSAALISKTSDPQDGIEITNGAGGLATITITPADTAIFTSAKRGLLWDLQFVSPADEVYTLEEGLLNVSEDVTREVV